MSCAAIVTLPVQQCDVRPGSIAALTSRSP